MIEQRPKPDDILNQTLAERRADNRGHLKIYLGMAAGVGKTYAMLSDAITEAKRGLRVVAGYIEPHGREETEALAEQFPKIENRSVEYRGITLQEFDLDEAIRVKPDIILVDELAHTNAPGSRHLKRYQDIEELCAKGINVWTTLNIQHVESMRDVVASITGVEVYETVPDSIVAQAKEIELVDIPPDELIQRLEAGKVYSHEKVETALRSFFQKGNLVALREILLRHAADTVDAQLRTFRASQGVKEVWATNPRVLVSIAPTPFAPRLVRAAVRLAANLRAPLVAVTVETARTRSVSEINQLHAERALKAAERAGAEIIRTSGSDVVSEILNAARKANATIVIVGKPMRSRLREYVFGSIVDDLIRRSGKIDVHVVQGSAEEAVDAPLQISGSATGIRSVVETLLWVILATGFCGAAFPIVSAPNLVMVYLLVVAWIAFRYGQRESLIASVLSVLAFDFFFVPPHLTFAVSDAQYLITFAVMWMVAFLISSLSLRLKAQSELASEREQRSSMLLQFSKQFTECRSVEEIARVASDGLMRNLNLEGVIFWPERDNILRPLNSTDTGLERDQNEIAVASWVSDRRLTAGRGTTTLPAVKGYYAPLDIPGEKAPVWGVFFSKADPTSQAVAFIDGLSLVLASALRRLTSEKVATEAHHRVQQEELRNILLSSVSHDLRTPLTSICGAASAQLEDPNLSSKNKELAKTIVESATRLSGMVRNVLDLSRLESGEVKLNREWHALEEIIEVAVRRTEEILSGKDLNITIVKDLPLLLVDGLLLEQVFVNLLENIGRHARSATNVELAATLEGEFVKVTVSDNGPGIESGMEEQIFKKLARGKNSQGFGLGLAICDSIVKAHGGKIEAGNGPLGGVTFTITLPISNEGNPQGENEGACKNFNC